MKKIMDQFVAGENLRLNAELNYEMVTLVEQVVGVSNMKWCRLD